MASSSILLRSLLLAACLLSGVWVLIAERVLFYQSNESTDTVNSVPKWIEDYISWHRQMRIQFPGTSLVTDPDAPPLLVKTCLGLCGGLVDRLGSLPLDLYLANQTKRVLLILWIKPQPLEEFLIPPSNGLDWTFPSGVEGWGTGCRTLNECMKQVRAHPNIENVGGEREEANKDFGAFIEQSIRRLNEGEYKDDKAVTFTVVGHLNEDYLESKLGELGETDLIHTTSSYGHIFKRLFTPHPNVKNQIDESNTLMGLTPGQYSVVHCRVRHPQAYAQGDTFNGEISLQQKGRETFDFVGRFKEIAIGTASKAIQCAVSLPNVEAQPIYFMSDSSDLVTYMTESEIAANASAQERMVYNIVARNQNITNAHIDKNKGRPAEAYYATFVDLYLAMNARCISFGVGNYAVFAGKLSGTKCTVRYAKELWGNQDRKFHKSSQQCDIG